MKFRAEPKDLAIFGCFCFFLLYMCAIGVVNVSSLATEGTFSGLLPFKAFTPHYIGSTLTLFVMALIGTFMGVSSYIFDREKGFGFALGKKDKGYSRWAKDSEIKKELVEVDPKAYNAPAGGLPLINNGKKMWVDNGEAHNIVVGSTGSGKTQSVVFPMVQSLAKHEESMIITDPKGEIYENTANMLKERGYNIIILNFRNPQEGNAWNPLTLPYRLYKEGNADKAIELLDDLALNILYEEKNSGDPFWEKSGADYFSGLALGLFEDAEEPQINLNSMNLMSSLGEERFGGPNNNYIKEYFNSKDPSRPAYINASGVVYTAEETKQGVLATFKQKVKIFSSRDNLSEMLSYSDFDMKDIGRKKTAVFLIVQDEKKTLHPLATIFIKQCYETLIDVAQENKGHLPYRTNFILDEFANMPPLKDVTTMVTAARSRHIRFTFIIQNYAQLTQVYGKEQADTIKGNCNIMYLITSELQALEEISKMCGEVKSKEKDKTASQPLVTVSDLQRLKMYEAIIMRLRLMPYKTKLTPDYKMDWGKTYEKAGYPSREKKPVELWDIREFVKNMKKEKMEQMMSDTGISAPPPSMTGSIFDNFISPPLNPDMTSSMPSDYADTPIATPSFNVDDLVKRIDAKIAELEEEERREKLEMEYEQQKPSNNAIMDQLQSISEAAAPTAEKPAQSIPSRETSIIDKPIIEEKEEKIDKQSLEDITKPEISKSDDAFFDDFFSDE